MVENIITLDNMFDEFNEFTSYEVVSDSAIRKTAKMLGMENSEIAELDEIEHFMNDHELAGLTLKLFLKCYENTKPTLQNSHLHKDVIDGWRTNVKEAEKVHKLAIKSCLKLKQN